MSNFEQPCKYWDEKSISQVQAMSWMVTTSTKIHKRLDYNTGNIIGGGILLVSKFIQSSQVNLALNLGGGGQKTWGFLLNISITV